MLRASHAGHAKRHTLFSAAIATSRGLQLQQAPFDEFADGSYAEAAAIAGVSEDVLRTRLHRARSRLAQQLAAGDRA